MTILKVKIQWADSESHLDQGSFSSYMVYSNTNQGKLCMCGFAISHRQQLSFLQFSKCLCIVTQRYSFGFLCRKTEESSCCILFITLQGHSPRTPGTSFYIRLNSSELGSSVRYFGKVEESAPSKICSFSLHVFIVCITQYLYLVPQIPCSVNCIMSM